MNINKKKLLIVALIVTTIIFNFYLTVISPDKLMYRSDALSFDSWDVIIAIAVIINTIVGWSFVKTFFGRFIYDSQTNQKVGFYVSLVISIGFTLWFSGFFDLYVKAILNSLGQFLIASLIATTIIYLKQR